LAIEEQFYLVWPLAVLLCSKKGLMRLCIGIVLGCFLLRNLPVAQAIGAQYNNFLYRLTPFRIDSIVFGAFAAVIARNPEWRGGIEAHLRKSLFLSGATVVAVVLIAETTSPHSESMTRFGYSALGFCFACGVLSIYLQSGSRGALNRAIRNPILMSFGKYSYGMYIFHLFMNALIDVPVIGHILFICSVNIIAKIVSTYVIAFLSWNCFEQHFLKLRDRVSYQTLNSLHLSSHKAATGR
jgi:peptidoglycan/LPS O-acetylase OafA/YrhL